MNPFTPNYQSMHHWELFCSNLPLEFLQLTQEGKDVEQYKELFLAAAKLPNNEEKKKIADILFELGMNAPVRGDYPYTEPSDLEGIFALRGKQLSLPAPDKTTLANQVAGAWLGRICGCLLGKPIEGMAVADLHRLLKLSNNDPLHRYFLSTDVPDEVCEQFSFPLKERCYADTIPYAVADDDTNYTAMAQWMIERYGRDFTPAQVGETWLFCQPKDAYCTAERVAFKNLVNGFTPPETAIYQNPYREWIGAQIRGDYYGYINPGDPQTAAEMAWRDASISHTKNGIYGEMLVAAMLATAAVTDDLKTIVQGGLSQIPTTSRLYEMIAGLLGMIEQGRTAEECFKWIYAHHPAENEQWVHTFPNALIVVTALLFSEGDYSKAICLAVQAGYDTDCNGATVGSIMGMRGGLDCIGKEWTAPVNDTLETTILGVGNMSISQAAEKTMKHIL
ncbi:MAG: ADP-ribosylglycohydrolase family protein [Clostridia bacterium]|nr:ADP-ribosylglycohydrolase family protein [Clostridia bacterium]